MPPDPTACPSVELLAAFIVGELPAAELEPLEVHLDACEECVCVVHAACPDRVTGAELLEHYEVLELIGRGGMGSVYRARDRRTGQLVAVKRMALHSGDATLVARYRREVDVLLRINHPNIVGIEDYGVEDGGHYIVMEYVAGGSLRQHMHRAPQWPVERVLELIIEIADALARLHQLGVIHRDVKPENILMGADGKPRLADFGLVKINEARLTATGGVPGTLAYLSPEALSGDTVDGRADVWSLGLVAFELLAGQHPFRGSSPAQTLDAISRRPLPELGRLRPDLPQSVIGVILRMLEKDCSRRTASARRVAAELETALTALRLGSRPAPTVAASTAAADARPQPLRPNHLRGELGAFIGRRRELEQLEQLVAMGPTRLVTVLGPGGIGKSRLALELGHRLVAAPAPPSEAASDPVADGVFWVELAHLDGSDPLASALADAVRFPLRPEAPAWPQLLDFLRNKRLLLVLDNFDHLLPCAPLVRELLLAAPGVRVVATSREPLGIAVETRWSLEGMSVPGPGDTSALLDFSGVQLFLEAARRVNPGFSPVGEDVSHVADVCRRVEGNPLAIVLAASWAGVLAPAEIASELSRSRLLTTEAPDGPDRHRSVHAICERSLELLDVEQRAAFSRLAVFRGGFSRASAEVVAGADLHTLSALVNKSLVVARPAARRYDLHELLRQCGEDRLRLEAGYEQTKDRHAAFYVQLLSSHATELFGRSHRAARDALEVELGNVHAAWHWLLRRGALEGLEQVAAAVEDYYERRGSSADAAALFGAAVERLEADAARHGDRGRRLLGWSLCLQGYHCQRQALLGPARAHVRRALEVLNPEQDPREYGRALIMAASVARGHEEAGRVVETAERGIALLREAGDRWLLARALALVAPWLYEHGAHVERAEAHLRESIRLQREMAGQVVLPTSLGSFAFGRARQGYFEEGREQLREALAIATQLDDVWSVQRCLRSLAQTERSRGDYGSALALATRDLDLSQFYGAREEESWAQLAIAEIEIDLGRLDEARARLEACPSPPATPELFIALIDLNLADIARATGGVELAVKKCESSLAAFARLNIAWAKATAHTRLGELAGARGDDMGAMAHLRAGLAFAAGARRAPLVVRAAAGWAELHARAGNTGRALEVAALLAQHHATEHGTRTRRIQPLLEALRARCTPAGFDAAIERSRGLSLEAFVDGLDHDLPVRG